MVVSSYARKRLKDNKQPICKAKGFMSTRVSGVRIASSFVGSRFRWLFNLLHISRGMHISEGCTSLYFMISLYGVSAFISCGVLRPKMLSIILDVIFFIKNPMKHNSFSTTWSGIFVSNLTKKDR